MEERGLGREWRKELGGGGENGRVKEKGWREEGGCGGHGKGGDGEGKGRVVTETFKPWVDPYLLNIR